jgi:hypothetical protein
VGLQNLADTDQEWVDVLGERRRHLCFFQLKHYRPAITLGSRDVDLLVNLAAWRIYGERELRAMTVARFLSRNERDTNRVSWKARKLQVSLSFQPI